jgi:hypothetical protein
VVADGIGVGVGVAAKAAFPASKEMAIPEIVSDLIMLVVLELFSRLGLTTF